MTAETEQSTGKVTPGADVYQVVRQRDFGVWKYTVTNNRIEGLHASVSYKHDSVSDIRAYAAANEALLPEIERRGGRVEVAVTFVPPMSPDQFRTWTRAKGVQVSEADMRTDAPGSSNRGTLGINATVDDPLPQAALDSVRVGYNSGVFGLYGTADAGRLSEIAADKEVFLVDVTPAWIRNDMAQAGIQTIMTRRVDVVFPFWDMETLGLQNFTNLPLPTSVPPPIGTIEPVRLPTAP